jgi:hypothetical protein
LFLKVVSLRCRPFVELYEGVSNVLLFVIFAVRMGASGSRPQQEVPPSPKKSEAVAVGVPPVAHLVAELIKESEAPFEVPRGQQKRGAEITPSFRIVVVFSAQSNGGPDRSAAALLALRSWDKFMKNPSAVAIKVCQRYPTLPLWSLVGVAAWEFHNHRWMICC